MNIPIVFATDNNYVMPTGIAITSLIFNKNEETCYDIYILSDNVSNENLNLLNSLSTDSAKIHIINYDNYKLKSYKPGTHLSATTFLKFELPELFPQYDKILWLDGDILVQKDLSPLFNNDLKDYYATAVRDMPGEVSFNFPQRVKTTKYFNAGVLLLNAKKIRNDFPKEMLYKTLDEYPEFLTLGDQDVFNYRFKENVLWLDCRYNLMMYNFLMLNYSIEQVNNFFNINYNSLEDLQKDAYIIHLTNSEKPWKYKHVFMSNEWAEYHSKSPFKNIKIHYLDSDSFESWAANNFVVSVPTNQQNPLQNRNNSPLREPVNMLFP